MEKLVNLRRLVQIAIGACVALASRLVHADQARKPTVIGLVLLTLPTVAKPDLDAFKDGLRELEYVEGENVLLVPDERSCTMKKRMRESCTFRTVRVAPCKRMEFSRLKW